MEKKIHCLIWPELNNYTGKTKTIATFESERGVDLNDFLKTVNSFWSDLKTIILHITEKATKNSVNLDAWLDFELKDLSEQEIQALANGQDLNDKNKYKVKTYLLKSDDTNNFIWKKFTNYVLRAIEEKYKTDTKIAEVTSTIVDGFFGPLCDTFWQDETNSVPINRILPMKQMVANFFASAVKFLNSPTITGKIDAS